MKKFRKEGNIILFALFYFLFISLIVAIFISLTLMSETYQRVQTAAETGARTRALSVNIPLKEQYGIIETFRPDSSEGYNPNYKEPEYSFSPTPGYDHPILSPTSSQYKASLASANTAAKQMVISSIEGSLGTNEAGDKIVDLKSENICIQVLPLPAGDSITKRAKLNFTCTATVNGKPVTITANNVEVYGYNHSLNTSGKIKVYNVVFVGVAYEDKHFFYNLLQRLINGEDESKWNDPPVRGTYAIGYPQIDSCTTDEC
ncbi:TadE/TadG family type IV pilus assembly protein [Priestia aryabhattai]